jgi:hypothetical protein
MAEALRKDPTAWKHVTEVLRFSPDVIAELCLGLYVDPKGRRWLAYPNRRAGAWTYANCRSLDDVKSFVRVPRGQKTQVYRVDALEEGGMAILSEGERDAASALTMGLNAELGGAGGAAVVSMPGVEQVEVAATALAKQQLVYLATDNDTPGEEAAQKLAARLGPERCRRVRFDGFKDLGDLLSKMGLDEGRTAALQAFRRGAAEGPFGSTGDDEPNDCARVDGIATIVRLSEVRAEAVSWLWEGRIPRGKLSLLDGDPGLGKSTLALDLAARVSTGSPMPGSASLARSTPAGVVLISHEDGLADTIRPRLDAAGADVSRVVAIMGISEIQGGDRLPALPEDTTEIEACVARTKAALVIIDPFVAYLGAETNSSKDQDVRRALMPLATMAQRTGVAILLVRHLNKQLGGPAIYRGGGSIGIVGAVRSGMLVARDPDDETARVLAPIKNNLAPPQPSLRFRIVPSDAASRVEWLGESHHGADGLLASAASPPDERDALREAEDALRSWLADGPVEVKALKKLAQEADIAVPPGEDREEVRPWQQKWPLDVAAFWRRPPARCVGSLLKSERNRLKVTAPTWAGEVRQEKTAKPTWRTSPTTFRPSRIAPMQRTDWTMTSWRFNDSATKPGPASATHTSPAGTADDAPPRQRSRRASPCTGRAPRFE